ncbi:unnamed protein product, partial [Staurois parvus]
SILQVVLIYYHCSLSWSKTAFDLKGRFLDAMDISQISRQKETVKMQAGHRTKH